MQKVPVTRRRYNKLVANELLEDFALRFTAKRARKWSAGWIANTALGIVSFLVLEALGGTITLNYGVVNSLWAIGGVSLVVMLSGIPICYYAARYGVDADLLSRGAGFGYIGSTIASLIYASFTFIFFALEAAIMSMALQLLFGIELFWGYILSAVIVIPLVTLGISNIGRFQMWSQPLWLLMQIIPLFYVFSHPDSQLEQWLDYGGVSGHAPQFDWLLFGAASAVLLSVVAQIGEQVDFLRFLPAQTPSSKWRWWAAMLIGGPGWMLFGALKIALGSFLAWLAITRGIAPQFASDPAHMYVNVFQYTTDNTKLALLCAGCFVIISQLKINVANAYAGSLAWSNFFSRLTHHHPGRVVWMVFNVLIALLLMELGVYQLIEQTLQVYSVLVLAWIGSIVADLVINKPLGLSPKHIEFKRSKLYDINPVGLGSMIIASSFGLAAHLGAFNDIVKAFASYLSFALPFLTAPLIALATRSRFYLVPKNVIYRQGEQEHTCVVCEHRFEEEDMALCPAYKGHICSLCCSLDVRCHDKCRPEATFHAQLKRFLSPYLPGHWIGNLSSSVSQFVMVMVLMSLAIGAILALAYSQVPSLDSLKMSALSLSLFKAFTLLLIPIGVISWLFVLARRSSRLAMNELQAHTNLLSKEITAHQRTSEELERAKRQAETANNAKSRYLAGLSHELRTPLNVLLGYAQLLSNDQELSAQKRQYAETLQRNGKHLGDLLESLLEISKIEAGRMELHRDQFNLHSLLEQLVEVFELQAERKGLDFEHHFASQLPKFVSADKQRLRQILINLLNNAVKYTEKGMIVFSVSYRNQVARFQVSDTGIGISSDEQALIFRPFERIQSAQTEHINGTGLGLTISNALAELMGGEITCVSEKDCGSTFTLNMMLPPIRDYQSEPELSNTAVTGYLGAVKTILVVDDIHDQRELISNILSPLGFKVLKASNADTALTLAKNHHIDLFMLDIFMPQVNGWQLAIKLRQQHYQQPIVMLSANIQELEIGNQENVSQLQRYHNGYLTKPVVISQLLGKLSQLLSIEWTYVAKGSSLAAASSYPSNAELAQLKSYAEIGYLSAFNSLLDKLEAQGHQGSAFIHAMREDAQQCRFADIVTKINGLTHE
ncbi:Signal transduction histidine kinase [Vibrio xiamenensis]|uniref:histidine kinase n=1 Tax=Vibrio xiamenensis TaxID=861298 RepID=A0A1G8AME1_9VIBR|nr:ATP-binding protein [Vibrio xiamenensis]SDH22104.1 Signal transduction histidine kinase [Vibrio xiamenensis]